MKELRQDPYEVLHLGRAATARDIGRAYRALVRTRHPDTRAPPAPCPPVLMQGRKNGRSCRRSWMPRPFSATRQCGPPTTGNGPRRRRRSPRHRTGTPCLVGLS